jgi:hypothetical protein
LPLARPLRPILASTPMRRSQPRCGHQRAMQTARPSSLHPEVPIWAWRVFWRGPSLLPGSPPGESPPSCSNTVLEKPPGFQSHCWTAPARFALCAPMLPMTNSSRPKAARASMKRFVSRTFRLKSTSSSTAHTGRDWVARILRCLPGRIFSRNGCPTAACCQQGNYHRL